MSEKKHFPDFLIQPAKPKKPKKPKAPRRPPKLTTARGGLRSDRLKRPPDAKRKSLPWYPSAGFSYGAPGERTF